MKKMLIVPLFVLLAACGADDSAKFIGQWIDENPEPAKKVGLFHFKEQSQSISVEPAGKEQVAVTINIQGLDRNFTYKVVKNNLITDTGHVAYTYQAGSVIHADSGKALVKK